MTGANDPEGNLDPRSCSDTPFKDTTNHSILSSHIDKPASTRSRRRRRTRVTALLLSFPAEILGMIFEYYVGRCTYANGNVREDALLRPFRCAAVCPKWRSVALGNKRLWTQIAIPSLLSSSRARYIWGLIKLSLSRSASLPLDIAISWFIGADDLAPTYIDILAVLAQHCSRWRELSVSVGRETVCSLFFDSPHQFLSRPTPNLETVSLKFPVIYSGDEQLKSFGDCLPHTPKLRAAHLENVPGDFDPDSQPGEATTLSIHDKTYYLSRFRSTVSYFPAITSLKLRWSTVVVRSDPGLPLVLPELEALVFDHPVGYSRDTDPESYDAQLRYYLQGADPDMRPILDRIVAPKLHILVAHVEYLHRLDSFIGRFADLLTSIEVYGLQPASPLDTRAVTVLANASRLRRLRFADCDLTADFLRNICEVEGDIWPELLRLQLDSVRCDDEQLLRFVNERYPTRDAVSDFPVPVVVVDINGGELDQSSTAAAISSLLDDERRQRSLQPTI